MLLQFGLDEQPCCVDLVEPACGFVVSVDGVVGVVEDDDGCFWHYKNISNNGCDVLKLIEL